MLCLKRCLGMCEYGVDAIDLVGVVGGWGDVS